MTVVERIAGHVRGSLALDAARPQLGAGLRAATALAVPLLAAWLTRRPELVWSGLGGWLAMLADPGGPYRARAMAMVTFAAAGAATCFAGGMAGQWPWIAVPALFVCALLCSLVRVRGDTAATIGVLSLIMFCITEGTPAGIREGLLRAEMLVAGALFAILLAVAVWPFRPYHPVREAVASAWSVIAELGSRMASIVAMPSENAAWEALVPIRRRAREALERARRALGVARAGQQGETGRGLQLLVLYEIAELALGDLAALLEALRARAERGQAVSKEIAEAVRELSVAHDRIARVVVERGPVPEAVPSASLVGDPELAALFARVEAETRHAVESAQALAQGGTGPPPPGALAPPDAPPSLRDAFAPGSIELRHALRVAIVATAAQVVATAIGLERSYWVTITVIIVLQPHAIATVQRGLQRVGGTVIGGIVAALIVRFVRQPLVIGALLFALAWAGVAVRRINYAAFATLITPVFVLLAEVNARGGHLTRARIFDTLLGGALALAGAILLWPTRDFERMPSLVAAVLRVNERYLRAVLGNEGPAAVVAARRAVGLATANAEAALQRLIGESRPAARLEPLMALVAYARRLSASITALGSAPVPAADAERLLETLGALANAAERGETPPPLTPMEDRMAPEPAQRLARQLRVVQSALARLA
jgi:uncharacterized membrane protein YccC